jgi:hypothetical protein
VENTAAATTAKQGKAEKAFFIEYSRFRRQCEHIALVEEICVYFATNRAGLEQIPSRSEDSKTGTGAGSRGHSKMEMAATSEKNYLAQTTRRGSAEL